MNLALELFRSVPRYVAARALRGRLPGALAGPAAPLRLVNREAPRLPGDGWVRVRPRLSGICGSDLATLSGRSSFYFSPLVSMPFVPGHEVVGDLLDDLPPAANGHATPGAPVHAEGLPVGTRVVLDPVLACAPRGVAACRWCAQGATGRCDHITVGHLAPGLQTGYCADTGGGWSRALVAHRSQLHTVPDELDDTRAVLVEPLACAVHSVLRARIQPGETVLLVGAGTVGLFSLLALRELTDAARVTVVAKHQRQRELAERLGASDVVTPDRAVGTLRRSSRAFRVRPERGGEFLLGGADVAVDAVGSRGSLDLALRTVRAGGRVLLAGLPTGGADLTPIWFRELQLIGAYATAAEGDRGHSFDLALRLAAAAPLDGVLGATYPLIRWREAIDHAFAAGRLGTLKVAFDLTEEAV